MQSSERLLVLLPEPDGLKVIPFALPMKPIYPSELQLLKKAFTDTCYQEKIQCLLLQEIDDPFRLLETAKVIIRQKLREVTQLTECQALMECWVHLSRRMKRTKALRCFLAKRLMHSPLEHLSFSESGTFLLAVSTSQYAFVYDIEDLKTCYEFPLRSFLQPDKLCHALVTNTGEHVVVATANGRILSFATDTGSLVNEDTLHMSQVTALRANAEATKVAVGYDDSLIRLLTLPGLTTLLDLKKQYIEIQDLCVFENILGSIDKSGHTLYWDTENSVTVERVVMTGMRNYLMRGPQLIGLMDAYKKTVVRTVNCASKQDREFGDMRLGTSTALQLGEDMQTVSCLELETNRLHIYSLATNEHQEVQGPDNISKAVINPGYPLIAINRKNTELELWAVEWELEQA